MCGVWDDSYFTLSHWGIHFSAIDTLFDHSYVVMETIYLHSFIIGSGFHILNA